MHDVWLRSQRFDQPGRQLAYDAAYETVVLTLDRRDRLDAAIATMAADSELHRRGPPAGLPAWDLHVDRVRAGGRDRRLDTGSPAPRSARSSAWCPTEHSSGAVRSQGSITKTGNTHARRLLVEAAWHHAKPYRTPGKTMRDRWELARPRPGSAATKATGGCTNAGRAFNARKKKPVIANVAVARELAGWAWSLAVLE